ncbi:MAG: ion transporter [Rhodobacteraceae bacterium]|jgi:voltage-gated potassium channel|nr:ion transporter [Paracoccaceae bacterium]
MQPSFRHRVSHALDPEMNPEPGLSGLNVLVVVAILVMVLVGVLETEVHVIRQFGGLMGGLKLLLFAFFAAEYGLRIWVAGLNPRYRNGLHYAMTPAALLDLAVLVTFVTPFLGVETTVFRLLQMTRLFRLARIGRYSRAMNLLFEAIRSRDIELALSAGLAFVLMLGAATLLYIVEGDVQPEAFGSIPRAMWWAVATLTTVGYGDVVPITPLGRILAAITAICGIGFIALPTGILASAFSEAIRKARDERAHGRYE